jgi:arginine decarboxylase
MIDEIINQIKIACDEAEVDAKHFTEFGSFTVGERRCYIPDFVPKQQNDREMEHD